MRRRCSRCSRATARSTRRASSTSSPPPRTSPSIAREVGGDRVTVESIARGLPGSALRRGEAELHPASCSAPTCWSSSAASSRSAGCRRSSSRAATRRSSRAAHGYLDASLHARILDIPQGQITRAMGDVHPRATRTTGSIRRTARRSPATIADKLSRAAPGRQGVLRAAPRRLHAAPRRGGEALAGDAGAVQGAEGRHLSPLVSELRRPLRPRRHRLRRAAARHSAVAAAHARPDQRDEAAEREADPGRAVLRPEDAERDRPRRPAAQVRRAAAVGRRRRRTCTDYIKLFDYDVKLLVDAARKDAGRSRTHGRR